MCGRILSLVLMIGMAAPAAAQVELPNEFQAGEPASAGEVNANFDAVATGLNDLATRVTDLEPEAPANLPLAVDITGDDVLLPIRGIGQGGLLHARGSIPAPDPIVVRGLPGDLSALIEDMALSRRIGGRVMRVDGEMGTPLLAFDRSYVTRVSIPAVGPGAEAPFLVAITVEPEEADVGPFSSEQATAAEQGSLFEPSVELSLGGIGVTVTALSVDPVVVIHPRGTRISVDGNPVLRIPAADAGPVLDAFSNGRRIDDIRIRYQRPDGTTVLAVTAAQAYIEYAAPDYTGDGVTIELGLQDPGVAEY